MKTFVSKLVLWIGFFSIVLLARTGLADGHNGHHQSGITGRIDGTLGFQWIVMVSSSSDTFTVLADESGRFEGSLKPGDYVLTAFGTVTIGGQLFYIYCGEEPPTTKVTVEKKQYNSAVLITGCHL